MAIIDFVRRLFQVCLVLAIGGASSLAAAQSFPYNIEVFPQRGAMSNADAIHSGVDAIDVSSGKLSVEIPLTVLPAGHAGSSFALALIYDSHLYQMAPGPIGNGTAQFLFAPTAPGGRAPGAPGGWNYNYQVAGPRNTQRYLTTGNCKNSIDQRRRHMAWFVLPDGSAHLLHLSGYGDERADNYMGDGFYELSLTGYNSCSPGASVNSGKLTYYTVDGSFLRFEIQANGANTTGPTSTQTWTLLYPDGRRITGIGSTATAFYDANGNRFRVENYYAGSLPYTVIKDDFDRAVRIDFDVPGAPSGQKRDLVTAASPVGPVNWAIDWHTIALDSNNAAPRYYICRASDNLTCRLGVASGNTYIPRELIVVKTVQLPEGGVSNTPPDWNTWTFGYSGDAQGGFGELNQIRTPDGATYDYTYRYEQTVPSTAQLLHANGVKTKRVTHDGVTDMVWTWSYASASDGDFTTTVVQPDGGSTVYHYANPLNLARWDRGLVYRVEAPLGTVKKREWARNLAYSIRGSNNTAPPNNPYVKKETSTVGNAAGVPSQTAVADFSIDKNGNVTSSREYTWVGYSPTQIENGVRIVRQTSRTYYVETPAASEAMNQNASAYVNAYWNASGTRTCGEPGQQWNVALTKLDALRRVTVSDLAAVKAASEFAYDCAYTSGNLTTEWRWDSRKSASVPPLGGMSSTNAVILRTAFTPSGDVDAIYAPLLATDYFYNGGESGPYLSSVQFGGGEDIRSETFEWDVASGTRKSETDDQSGLKTTYTYDLYGRTRTAIETGLRGSEAIYNNADRIVLLKQDRETLGDGQLQRAVHRDQLGRVILTRVSDGAPLEPTATTDGVKVTTRYVVAPGGARVITSSPYRAGDDATLEWSCVQYDTLGRVSWAAMYTGPNPPNDCSSATNRTGVTVTSYDANRIRTVDPAGKTRDAYYDALGRLIEVREDPTGLNYTTNYQYNALGNLITAAQSDGATTQFRTFVYSSLGRLISATNPETGTITYDYDDDGKLISRSDARSTVTYCYDQLHRLEGKRYGGMCAGPETFDVFYTYYPNDVEPNSRGRLASVSSWEASSVFTEYDDFGRARTNVQTIQTTSGVSAFTLRYGYRLDGSIASITYPSGKIVTYDSDTAGRTTRVVSGNIVYADLTAEGIETPFTPDGRIRQMKLGNDLWETHDYRTPAAPSRLQLGTAPDSGDVLQLEYNYAPTTNNGNVASQAIRRGVLSWNQNYTYDTLNRLSSVAEPGGWARTYGYDRFGNRWIASTSGLTLRDVHEPTSGNIFDKSTNRLNNALYDDTGNQTQIPGNPLTFDYDAENRLTRAQSLANGNAYFGYDGDGRRVWKSWTPNGGQPQITYYIYGLHGEVLAEYSNQAPTPSGRTYVFSDLLGSVRAITSDKPSTGPATILECYDYLPFGRILSQTDNGRDYEGTCHPTNPDYLLPSADSEKFTGKIRDTEIQLDYFGARYYSAPLGRFTTPDLPFADQNPAAPQTWNLYIYARDNPLRYIDPDGRQSASPPEFARGLFIKWIPAGPKPFDLLDFVVAISGPRSIKYKDLDSGRSPILPGIGGSAGGGCLIPCITAYKGVDAMYIFTLTLTHEQNGRVKAKLNAFQDTTARFWGDPKVKAPETVFVGLAGFGPVAKFQSIDVDRNALRGLTTKEFLAVLDAVSSYPITANPDLRNALMKVLRIEEERRRMNHEAIPPKITLPKMSDPKAGFPTVVLPEDLPGRTGGQR